MTTKFTILCDNSAAAASSGIAEHGFACYLENEEGSYLFDTGQGLGIVHNSIVLKKDLSKINAIMLSHGHYDHTGGLAKVLRIIGERDVYAHPDIFAKKYKATQEKEKFVGIPFNRAYLESLGANFQLNTQLIEIGRNIYLTGEVPRLTDFEKGVENLFAYTDTGEKIQPDPLKDDLSVIVDSDRGLVIVFGCAHAGMINIINYTVKSLNKNKIYAVIGGTHLMASSDAQFTETLKMINEYKIEHVGVSHCTGPEKASLLHAKLKDRFFFASVSTEFEV
ncbi:MAG: MBL fold metallo-hydrolase [Candidatus Aureabacteria bacterium]|nr:MBL fold metallo-hydrolase [Candidatus Auribacterota bacterium]